MNGLRTALLAAPLAAILAGCAGNQVSPIAKNSPDWVNKGSGAFKATDGMGVFYGVGLAPKMSDRYLNMKVSDERARGEVAAVMSTYVKSLTKSYTASTVSSDAKKASDESYVSATMKTLTDFTLHGAEIVDHWKDPSDGSLFSLCKLDMATFKKSLDQATDVDAAIRDYVKANADKAFDELNKAHGQ